MLSYRHAFHAGNHADVLKHLCLLAVLQRLCSKPKPLCYLETHAGAGRYELDSEAALKTAEFSRGVGALLRVNSTDPLLTTFQGIAQQHQSAGHYPGSPVWAQTCLRPDDQTILCELHPTDFASLKRWAGQHQGIHVHQRDGHEAARALLPPAQKRGLVLIDPAYESKQEYQQCVATIAHIRKHFRSACIALWYPRLPRRPDQRMLDAIGQQCDADQLHITLDIAEPSGDYGMFGSGMLIIQPPWQLNKTLQPALQQAASTLSTHPQLRLETISS